MVPRTPKTISTLQVVFDGDQEIIPAITGSLACILYAQMPESFLGKRHYPESNACASRHDAIEEKSLPNTVREVISLHILIMSDRISWSDTCDMSDLCPSGDELAYVPNRLVTIFCRCLA